LLCSIIKSWQHISPLISIIHWSRACSLHSSSSVGHSLTQSMSVHLATTHASNLRFPLETLYNINKAIGDSTLHPAPAVCNIAMPPGESVYIIHYIADLQDCISTWHIMPKHDVIHKAEVYRVRPIRVKRPMSDVPIFRRKKSDVRFRFRCRSC